MMQGNNSAGEDSIVSRNRVMQTMRSILRTAIIIERKWTVEELAIESGVKARAIRSYMSNDEQEWREPPLSSALSLLAIIGNRAVNSAVSIIGYVANPLDSVEARGPAQDAAEALRHVSDFVSCAFDNHIDHVEEPVATAACDNVIELLTPYSSRKGRAA